MKKSELWPQLKGLIFNIGLLMVVTLPTLAMAKNSFLVAPGRVDFDLSRPNTQSFIITNNGDDSIRLKIEPVYFAIDDKALAAGTSLNSGQQVNDDLRPFMRVSPRVLSLNPGERRDIRLSVRPKGNMSEGDYRAHVLIRMMETAQTFSTGIENESKNSVGMHVDIKLETAAAVYGHRGDRQPKLEIQCLRDQDGFLVIDIKNSSKWRFEGGVKVLPQDAENNSEALFTQAINSIRESQSIFKTKWKIPTNKSLKLFWKDNWEGENSGQVDCKFN